MVRVRVARWWDIFGGILFFFGGEGGRRWIWVGWRDDCLVLRGSVGIGGLGCRYFC